MRLSLFISLCITVCPTYSSFVTRNKAEGYWAEFIYFVISTSQLVHLGEFPWENKVKHISLHFAWKETPMIFAIPVASHSPGVTPGAHGAPSCSVNRLLCPGCIEKPQEYTTKARTFTRGQVPAHGMSCQGKKVQEEATLYQSIWLQGGRP